MRISTLGYVGKQGVKNIGRNKMFSIASIATMSACIFLFGLFFSIVLNLQHFVKTAEEGVAITVFFDEDATESQIEEIGKELRSRDDVLKVEYVSAECRMDFECTGGECKKRRGTFYSLLECGNLCRTR